MDDLLKDYYEKEEKRIFEELKNNKSIVKAVLIANPKHKGNLINIQYETNTPVLYSDIVEENRLYMVVDEKVAQNIKNILLEAD